MDGKDVSLLMALSVLDVFVRSHGVCFWCLVEACDEVFDKLHAEEEVSNPPLPHGLLLYSSFFTKTCFPRPRAKQRYLSTYCSCDFASSPTFLSSYSGRCLGSMLETSLVIALY